MKPDGTLRIVSKSAPGRATEKSSNPLSEGYYVAIVMHAKLSERAVSNRKIFRAEVQAILDDAVIVCIAESAVGELNAGSQIALLRPPGSTTAQMKKVPDQAPMVVGK